MTTLCDVHRILWLIMLDFLLSRLISLGHWVRFLEFICLVIWISTDGTLYADWRQNPVRHERKSLYFQYRCRRQQSFLTVSQAAGFPFSVPRNWVFFSPARQWRLPASRGWDNKRTEQWLLAYKNRYFVMGLSTAVFCIHINFTLSRSRLFTLKIFTPILLQI